MIYNMSRLIDEEELFRSSDRLSIYPIKYNAIWQFYKDAQSSNWTAEEIKFSEDLNDWEGLDLDTKTVVKEILGFFAGADQIVNSNLAENMMRIIDIPEVKCFYGFQIHIENVHNETYALMIENLIRDPKEKNDLLNSFKTMPGVKKLYDWAQNWIHHTKDDEMNDNPILKIYEEQGAHEEVIEDLAEIWNYGKIIVAFACIEGIMFSGAFAAIYWLKEKGILPGLTFSNELISRDEGLHRDFACLLFSMIKNKPPKEQVLEIVLQAVEFKKELIGNCMDRLPGLNRNDMMRYIEFVADSLLINLGQSKHFNVDNPLEFMEKISVSGITNFFEKRVGEYSVSGFEQGNDIPIELDDEY